MGNMCLKEREVPPPPVDTKKPSIISRQSRSSSRKSQRSARGYQASSLKDLKAKEINPRLFCRPSNVIHEALSVNGRDTQYSQRWSIISADCERATLFDCNNSKAIISIFQSKYQKGDDICYGDTIILKNLKQSSALFCKYEKHKQYDKQNLVSLQKNKSEENEMYLQWRIVKNNQDNEEIKFREKIRFDKDQPISMALEHKLTGCYLQSSRKCKISQRTYMKDEQIVSCGQPNKIVSEQNWQLELFSDEKDKDSLKINSLFKLYHCDTQTYLTSIMDQLCCFQSEKKEILGQKLETQKDENGHNLQQLQLFDFNNDPLSKSQINLEKIEDEQFKGKSGEEEKVNLLPKKEESIERMSSQKQFRFSKLNDQDNEIIERISIQRPSRAGKKRIVDIAQEELNEQLSNQFYMMNMNSEITSKEEEEQKQKKADRFNRLAKNGDIWYVSEIIQSTH